MVTDPCDDVTRLYEIAVTALSGVIVFLAGIVGYMYRRNESLHKANIDIMEMAAANNTKRTADIKRVRK